METLANPSSKRPRAAATSSWSWTSGAASLRRNLRRRIREAIQEGRLATGTRLPSSRRLATDLRVSRGVVADTYDQLTAEGYLETQPRQAPLVAGVGAAPPLPDEPARPTWAIDFIATTPDVELFPRRAWIRATERALRQAPQRRPRLRRSPRSHRAPAGPQRLPRPRPRRTHRTRAHGDHARGSPRASTSSRECCATAARRRSRSNHHRRPPAGARRRRSACAWRASRSTPTACGPTSSAR